MRISSMLIAFTVSAIIFLGKSASANRLPDGYGQIETLKHHAFRYTIDGEPVRRGNRAERFELRHGDCGGKDCRNDRIRSEFGERRQYTTARIGVDIWYGWSFHIEQSPHLPGRHRLYPFFGQWKMGGDTPPIVTFMQSDHGTKDTIFVSLVDMAYANGNMVAGKPHGNICKDIFSIAQAKSGWVDIVVNTNFSHSKDGYFKVWINGQLKCNYTGQIVATKTFKYFKGPNHRRGIYVGNTKYWKSKFGDKPTPTWIVYYDEFLAGNSREDVDTRMREAAGVKPKD